ncbi:carboxypeptidase-like regulatory domain-containing protein [Aureibacter tunicatorum]|uniref:Carboxypeptidase-like regulatory domain-containing protein n=1 Tax=Aureibacter tunicatorum TaxID=866807 RepID=A0AAE4BQK2_9BACT|nr:carboxypeptidase-like regulatory domain-containing protein [Aureibacter tunicatorum]MDR6237043.1 hypothetical protein [Aureibacter tunicatorum]BDD06035.1 hypothetical protein AUTU_35180 [Aureibacter tunicatorum]
MKYRLFLLLALWAFAMPVKSLLAQDNDPEVEEQQPIIQFSGQVVDGQSLQGMPGVHIFIPKTGRGVSTNYYGYFTMPVMAGDTIMVSSVGFVNKTYVIPKGYEKDISFVMHMDYDTLYLPEVQVMPYPTVRDFKQAVLSLEEVPYEDQYRYVMGNMNPDGILLLSQNLKYEPATNFKYDQDQQFSDPYTNRQFRTTNFLNPFAWSSFFKSMKKKDEK